MDETLLRDLFLGFIRIHILYHAEKERVFGTGLMEELSRHGYTVGPGTLYPMLHAMEARGMLVSEPVVVGGRRRRYYQITEYGRAALRTAREHTKDLIDEIMEE